MRQKITIKNGVIKGERIGIFKKNPTYTVNFKVCIQSKNLDSKWELVRMYTIFNKYGCTIINGTYEKSHISHDRCSNLINGGRGIDVSSIEINMSLQAKYFYCTGELCDIIKNHIYTIYDAHIRLEDDKINYITWFNLEYRQN